MDYEGIIRAIIEPLVDDKDSIMIRQMPAESGNGLVFLIVCKSGDTARLIGRKGVVANAIRDVVSVAGKIDSKRVFIKFESFDSAE